MEQPISIETGAGIGGIGDEFIDAVKEAAREENSRLLRILTLNLRHADCAELLSVLSSPVRAQVVRALGEDFAPDILTYLNEEIIGEIMHLLGKEQMAEALGELENDDALGVIEYLDEEDQQELLEALPEEERAELEEGLAYPEESAGRLMQTRFVSVPEFWDVGQVIDYLRSAEDLPEEFYEIIVVNPRFQPVGTVMTSRIVQNRREVPVRQLMKTDIHAIETGQDQEAVAELFRRYAIAETPVINSAGRVVGVITIDDIVHVIKEEEEEDFMRAGGILEQDIHIGLLETVKLRLPWLLMNLMTAAGAVMVIGHFDATIEKMVTLAVLMPVIASLSGNAGTQSLTVAVRGIATRELQRHNAMAVIRKEFFTNFLNALVLSSLAGTVIFLIYNDLHLSFIFACATVFALSIAGFAGSFIPLMLSRLKIDPAIASGVFLTTLTDALSFFSFLGLAAWFLV